MSDVVNSGTNHSQFSVIECSKVSTNAQEQEVNDLLDFLKIEHNKYIQYKVIYDTLEEYINSDDEEDTLKCKVRDIMLSENISQCLSLEEKCENNADWFLGIPDINSATLNFSESNTLQSILKHRLDQKYNKIKSDFYETTHKDVSNCTTSSSSVTLNAEDKLLLEYKNKLIAEQEEYIKNLRTLLDLLQEIKNLRLNKLPQIMEIKIKECQVEEKVNSLKCHGFQEKNRVDIFTETSCSLKAYKELIKDIKDQQNDCKIEIEQLMNLKQKYKDVSCKQYDDILKSYLQYKSSIEKKKLLYNCLKS